ncbi:MAG TPA: SHD1 domain-containing protein [Pirellulales bacterium]|jgi:hypothetical protein|nr:SHD1 domain-containing protein [Pirellulales bacterium]
MARAVLAFMLVFGSASALSAREWTDATGKYHQEAELVDFDGQLVVLKKAQGRLVAIPLDSLSTADQDYLKSQQAKADIAAAASKDRTWTLIDGKKLVGQVLKFGEKDITFSRKFAVLYVNGKPFKDLSEWRQYMALKLVSHAENKEFKDDDAVQSLIAARKGADLVYPVKGVLFLLQSGEEIGVPIWMLSDRSRAVLMPEWDAWLAAEKEVETKDKLQQEQSTMARAAANEYQRNQQAQLRLQYLQLASQWFDLWQVTLTAPNGTVSSVVVPARDSRQAQIAAQQQCPNCQIGATSIITRASY